MNLNARPDNPQTHKHCPKQRQLHGLLGGARCVFAPFVNFEDLALNRSELKWGRVVTRWSDRH